MNKSEKAKSPFLEGNFAPYRSEDHFDHLKVEGKIPEDLNGVLLRNGPNPQFDPIGFYHWFEGDGMLHAIRIKNGRASYDNRWIRTERFKLENQGGKPLFNTNFTDEVYDDQVKTSSNNTANTNIILCNQQLLALNEGSSPVQIQLKDLDTLGDYNFGGQITRALTAHPRYDHQTKEWMLYSYLDRDERLMYYRVDENNQLKAEKEIKWPYPAMVHDFINTANYVIFPIFPCTLSLKRTMQGEPIFMWEGDRLNTFFVVTNRKGEEVCKIETDPCYVYHFGNAYENHDEIIIDAIVGKCTGLMPDRHGKIATREDSAACLGRWIINLKNHSIKLTYLDETLVEFPRFDERFNGYVYQHLYTGGRASPAGLFDRIMHYNVQNGVKKEHHFGEDVPSEPVFVPRSEEEGDGYLLTVVYRAKENRSDVVILDAGNIEDKPLATIKIPHRIPFGFHGSFVFD